MRVPSFVQGNIAPVFTAFDEEKRLDPEGQRNLLAWLHDTGAVSAYFIRSGMGQMYTFTLEEVVALGETARAALGDAPMLLGCSGIWNRDMAQPPDREAYTAEAIALCRHAERMGADGAVITVPEGLRPASGETEASVVAAYVGAVCESTNLPVFLYQPPGTDEKYHLTPEQLAQLSRRDNLVGVKVSTNNAYYAFSLLRAAESREFAFITGDESIYYATLYAGSRAVIGGGCCVCPQILSVLRRRHLDGDRHGALAAQDSVNRLFAACRNHVDFVKCFASESGYPVSRVYRELSGHGYFKQPEPLSPAEYAAYKTLLLKELAAFAE